VLLATICVFVMLSATVSASDVPGAVVIVAPDVCAALMLAALVPMSVAVTYQPLVFPLCPLPTLI